MKFNRPKMGKALEWLGWLNVAHTLWTYGWGLQEAYSDASIRTYLGLIALEGLFFIGTGLFMVWLGCRVARPSQTTAKPDPPKTE